MLRAESLGSKLWPRHDIVMGQWKLQRWLHAERTTNTFVQSTENFQTHCLYLKFFFVFLGLHLWHMEVSRLGVHLELQLPAHTTATAMPDLRPTKRGQGSNPWMLVGFVNHWAMTWNPFILNFWTIYDSRKISIPMPSVINDIILGECSCAPFLLFPQI